MSLASVMRITCKCHVRHLLVTELLRGEKKDYRRCKKCFLHQRKRHAAKEKRIWSLNHYRCTSFVFRLLMPIFAPNKTKSPT